VISTGAKKAEVLLRCGEPAWRDEYQEEWYESGADLFIPHAAEEQVWVYNFGPTQFLRYLTFRNGVLQTIETGEHGFVEGPSGAHSCDLDLLKAGMHKFDVLQRCGQPTFQDKHRETRTISAQSTVRTYNIMVEEWTYNFGPQRFLGSVIFENGRLTDVQRGERGQ
jgi:hypothetical protein